MQQYKDIAISVAGLFTGTVSIISLNQILSVITAVCTIMLAVLALVRAAIQTIEAVKKHHKGEATTEETLEKIDQIREELKNEDFSRK